MDSYCRAARNTAAVVMVEAGNKGGSRKGIDKQCGKQPWNIGKRVSLVLTVDTMLVKKYPSPTAQTVGMKYHKCARNNPWPLGLITNP